MFYDKSSSKQLILMVVQHYLKDKGKQSSVANY